MLDTLPDGTPYFAPLGELPNDPAQGTVQCHLCGHWYRRLSGPHLGATHGWTPHQYRVAFGLRRTHPLQGVELSGRQARQLKRRHLEDDRVKEGMKVGLELARSGELSRLGTRHASDGHRTLDDQRRRSEGGRQGGKSRAAGFRARREQRARELGFRDLQEYLAQRYQHERVALDNIVRELNASYGAVVADMDGYGIVRQSAEDRLSLGRAALARRRAARRSELERHVVDLGFPDLRAYLHHRHHRDGWKLRDIAIELGLPARNAVGKLMRAERVNVRRGRRRVLMRDIEA
jgi:hypothetical protein